jgi:hypothetical protein
LEAKFNVEKNKTHFMFLDGFESFGVGKGVGKGVRIYRGL